MYISNLFQISINSNDQVAHQEERMKITFVKDKLQLQIL